MSTADTANWDRFPPGIYLIDAVQRDQLLRPDAFPEDFDVAVLNGEVAGTRAGIFQEIARGLRFPDYFGNNWDAVYDCLTDLNWLPAAGYVLVLDGFEHLANDAPGQWEIGLKVLKEAAAFWQPHRTPMYVLLFGPPELARGVPPLPAECLPAQQSAPAP